MRASACPLCGAGRIRSAGALDYEKPVRFSTLAIELERTAELWRCDACRSGFAQNALREPDARALYGRGDSTARWTAAPLEAGKMPEVLLELARHCAPGTRLLDIGANAGDLLDFARARGCETAGVEYSAAARAEIARRGHRAFDALDAAEGSYDLITAFDVAEHQYDLPGFLAACRARLRADGRILVLTGDIECASARFCGARWWYAAYPEHIVFPSRRYLAQVPGLALARYLRTYASPGYRMAWRARLPAIAVRLARGDYRGLPSAGPDHLLATLRAAAP